MNKLYILVLSSLISQSLTAMEIYVPFSTTNKENENPQDLVHLQYVALSGNQQSTQSQHCLSGVNGYEDTVVNVRVSDLSRLKEMLNIINEIRKASQLKPAIINLTVRPHTNDDFSLFNKLSMSERFQVKSLDLSNCGLRELPRSVTVLSGLRELTLDGNQIKFKSTDFDNFTELKELSIQKNGITHLPQGLLSPLKKLDVIDLEGNPLKMFVKHMLDIRLKHVHAVHTDIPFVELGYIGAICLAGPSDTIKKELALYPNEPLVQKQLRQKTDDQ